jgi:hypothetical protein
MEKMPENHLDYSIKCRLAGFLFALLILGGCISVTPENGQEIKNNVIDLGKIQGVYFCNEEDAFGVSGRYGECFPDNIVRIVTLHSDGTLKKFDPSTCELLFKDSIFFVPEVNRFSGAEKQLGQVSSLYDFFLDSKLLFMKEQKGGTLTGCAKQCRMLRVTNLDILCANGLNK